MKKIYTILALIASAMMFVGCQKDFDGILTAEIEGYNGGSDKVYINDSLYACWHNGDMVKINGTDIALEISGNTATIKTTLPDKSDITAIYPARYAATDGSQQFTLPQKQTYRTQDGKQIVDAPMVAYTTGVTTGTKVTFKNAGALIKVKVKNPTNNPITLHRIELIGSTALWGTVTYQQTSNEVPTNLIPANDDPDKDTIFLSFDEEPVDFSGQEIKEFFIAIPCVTTTLQPKIYYTNKTDHNHYIQKNSDTISAKPINRSDLFPMNLSGRMEESEQIPYIGKGTEDDPYLIYDYNDFDCIDNDWFNPKMYYYKQINDFSFPNNSTISISSFIGVYDGNNHTITNNMDRGVFESIENGTIKNLIVTVNQSTQSMQPLGGIVSSVQNATIYNCTVNGSISSETVGGIIGKMEDGDGNTCTIENCTNNANLTGATSVGSIAGTGAPTIINCSNTGTISGNINVAGMHTGYTAPTPAK